MHIRGAMPQNAHEFLHTHIHTNMLREQLTYSATLTSWRSLSLSRYSSLRSHADAACCESTAHTQLHTHTHRVSKQQQRTLSHDALSECKCECDVLSNSMLARLDSTLNSTRLSRAYWVARRFSPFANVVSVACVVLVVVGRIVLSHSDDLPLQ